MPAYVNSASGTNDASGASLAAGALNVSAGSLVVVAAFQTLPGSLPVTGVTDTAGNRYHYSGIHVANEPNGDYGDIYYTTNAIANASNVITATYPQSAGFRRIIANQYSGAGNWGYESGGSVVVSSGTTLTTSAGPHTSTNGGFIVSFASASGVITFAAGTNFSLRNTTLTDTASEDRLTGVTTATPFAAGWAWSGTFTIWAFHATFAPQQQAVGQVNTSLYATRRI